MPTPTEAPLKFFPRAPDLVHDLSDARRKARLRTAAAASRVSQLVQGQPGLAARFDAVTRFARQMRSSEYLITNACNIRCKGCWFFEHKHDAATPEVNDLQALDAFLAREVSERRINNALVIGGEPTLMPERLRAYARHMKHLTISTNGLKPLPVKGFENVAVAITLFGGGALDDELRGIKPSGRRFTGLFEQALDNYRNDRRAGFVYALTEDGIGHIEDTVRRIHANGNRLNFNFYSKYDSGLPVAMRDREALLAEALRVKALFPDTVVGHPYYIRAMVTGHSHWDAFSYDNCPSISGSHPAHEQRLANGNPVIANFNTWGADLETIKFCCTSGHCEGCRDSQALHSWLLVSMHRFLEDAGQLTTWVEIAESYWRQFVWSPWFDTPAA